MDYERALLLTLRFFAAIQAVSSAIVFVMFGLTIISGPVQPFAVIAVLAAISGFAGSIVILKSRGE